MTPHEELFAIAEKLKKAASAVDGDDVAKPLDALENAAKAVGRSFSGSWQGYHSRVYYANFSAPPPGDHFSQEWGLMDTYASSLGSRGDWQEYDAEEVQAHIRDQAGHPDLEKAQTAAKAARDVFAFAKSEILSLLHSELEERDDGFLTDLQTGIEKLEPLSVTDVARELAPKGQIMTRDTIVLGQGTKVPPHMNLRKH